MEFDIVAVTKLSVGICAVWLLAMGMIYLHLQHDKKKRRRC